jgi:hypothetical protein
MIPPSPSALTPAESGSVRGRDFRPCEAGRLCIRSEDTAAAGNDFLQWAGCGAVLGAVGLILIWQGSRQMRS